MDTATRRDLMLFTRRGERLNEHFGCATWISHVIREPSAIWGKTGTECRRFNHARRFLIGADRQHRDAGSGARTGTSAARKDQDFAVGRPALRLTDDAWFAGGHTLRRPAVYTLRHKRRAPVEG